MTDIEHAIKMAKTQQWEITKGHLRAVAVVEGSKPSSMKSHWQETHNAIEAFISDFEERGFNE